MGGANGVVAVACAMLVLAAGGGCAVGRGGGGVFETVHGTTQALFELPEVCSKAAAASVVLSTPKQAC